MKNRTAKLGVALLASAAALAFTHTSGAGVSYGNGGASCNQASCQGTLEGFRWSSDSSANADFLYWGTGGSFYGSVNGSRGSCTMQASQASIFQAMQGAPPQTYFYIQWGSDGLCNFIELGAFSGDF